MAFLATSGGESHTSDGAYGFLRMFRIDLRVNSTYPSIKVNHRRTGWRSYQQQREVSVGMFYSMVGYRYKGATQDTTWEKCALLMPELDTI